MRTAAKYIANFTTLVSSAGLWCLLLLVMPHSSVAQQLDIPDTWFGTSLVRSELAYHGGHLSGCTLSFTILARDNTDQKRTPVFLAGAFGLQKHQDTVEGYTKIVLVDLSKTANGDLRQVPVIPVKANVVTLTGVSTAEAVIQSIASDQLGYLISIVERQRMLTVIQEAIKTRRILVTASRRQDGMDITALIELDVLSFDRGERVRGNSEIAAFRRCLTSLGG